MNKKIAVLLCIILVLFAVCFSFYKKRSFDQKISTVSVPPMSLEIVNENADFSPTIFQANPYRLDFLKIKTISFAVKEEYMFIRYDLDKPLPKSSKELPSIDGDKINGLIFFMTLDDNYFDGSGQKNPGGVEASLKMSFYDNGGIDKTDKNKIDVPGDCVEGGLGYDFFVAKYSYRQLLLNQTGDEVVFTANSLAMSKNFPAGVSSFDFENSLQMADKDSKEIKIKLKPAN
jgi:hypothetical protein